MITVQVFISLEFYLQCQYQTNVPPIFTYLLLTSVVCGVYCKCSAHSPVSLYLSHTKKKQTHKKDTQKKKKKTKN